MNQTQVQERVKVMFPNGPQNHREEDQLRRLLNHYQMPYTDESIDKILNVNVNEARSIQ